MSTTVAKGPLATATDTTTPTQTESSSIPSAEDAAAQDLCQRRRAQNREAQRRFRNKKARERVVEVQTADLLRSHQKDDGRLVGQPAHVSAMVWPLIGHSHPPSSETVLPMAPYLSDHGDKTPSAETARPQFQRMYSNDSVQDLELTCSNLIFDNPDDSILSIGMSDTFGIMPDFHAILPDFFSDQISVDQGRKKYDTTSYIGQSFASDTGLVSQGQRKNTSPKIGTESNDPCYPSLPSPPNSSSASSKGLSRRQSRTDPDFRSSASLTSDYQHKNSDLGITAHSKSNAALRHSADDHSLPPVTNSDDEEHKPLLHIAVGQGNEGVARVLLSAGAKINERDATNGGCTALHIAVRHQHEELLKLLLERGADVNAADFSGVTPMHQAVVTGFETGLKLLLAYGADVNGRAKDSGKKRSLSIKE